MTRATTTVAKALATAFGAGYAPLAPGTCGTALTVPLAWALAEFSAWQYALVVLAIIAIGSWAAARADRAWGTHDSGRIVIDEVAGYLVTVMFVDRSTWIPLAAGFVVFRVLDIAKPPPVRWIDQRVPGGWGVVLDDVAAGAIGAAIMAVLVGAGL